jgi:hypothetical protein
MSEGPEPAAFDPTDHTHAEFRRNVKDWLAAHDGECRVKKECKEMLEPLRSTKKALNDKILSFMQVNGWQHVDLSDKSGKLKCAQAKRTETLKASHILQVLGEHLGDPAAAEQLHAAMLGKREVKLVDTLKRTRTRGGGGDDD